MTKISRRIENAIGAWNALYPPGTPVRVYLDNDLVIETTTRTAAVAMSDHASVWVHGLASSHNLTHVVPNIAGRKPLPAQSAPHRSPEDEKPRNESFEDLLDAYMEAVANHAVRQSDSHGMPNDPPFAEREALVADHSRLVNALAKIANLRYAEDANEPFDEALGIADAALKGSSPAVSQPDAADIKRELSSLLARVRPGSEAAPWVVEALKALVSTSPARDAGFGILLDHFHRAVLVNERNQGCGHDRYYDTLNEKRDAVKEHVSRLVEALTNTQMQRDETLESLRLMGHDRDSWRARYRSENQAAHEYQELLDAVRAEKHQLEQSLTTADRVQVDLASRVAQLEQNLADLNAYEPAVRVAANYLDIHGEETPEERATVELLRDLQALLALSSQGKL